jgi:hypothetical protein
VYFWLFLGCLSVESVSINNPRVQGFVQNRANYGHGSLVAAKYLSSQVYVQIRSTIAERLHAGILVVVQLAVVASAGCQLFAGLP